MVQKLIGSTHPNWEDMSPFVVHFTKKSATSSEYDNSISILASRRLEARNRLGIGKNHADTSPCVCFSEVPLHQLKRLADKRGSYGIVFRKEFIVARNGGPILYAYQDTPHALALRSIIDDAAGTPDDPIWRVAPFRAKRNDPAACAVPSRKVIGTDLRGQTAAKGARFAIDCPATRSRSRPTKTGRKLSRAIAS